MAGTQGRSWGQRFVLVANVLLIGSALSLAWMLNFAYGQVSNVDRLQLGGILSLPEETAPGERVLNILLVGYDSSAGLAENDPIQAGRQGERFGDVTIVLHIDEREGTASMLSIPRDLWLPIDGYGDRRLNYAFGIGGAPLLIETIEAELDIPIHYYMSVDFAGFQGLVEAVGHVDVNFDQPARDWNEDLELSQTGFEMLETGCQPLNPTMALAYVRSRYYQVQDDDGQWNYSWPPSDIGRIQRQQDFMYRLVRRAIQAGARNPFTLAELIDVSLGQIEIDQELTPQLLLDLGDTYRSFDPGELATYSYPSDSERINTAWVLLPLRDQAEAVLEIFRGTATDSPRTVHLTTRVDPSQLEMASKMGSELEGLGYEIASSTVETVQGGVIIQYGADGQQAAKLVAAALADSDIGLPVSLELVASDPIFDLANQGRSVVVVIGSESGAIDAQADEVETSEAGNAEGDSGTSIDGDEPPQKQVPEVDVDGSDGIGVAEGSASESGTC